jgi:hypothetical protein
VRLDEVKHAFFDMWPDRRATLGPGGGPRKVAGEFAE